MSDEIRVGERFLIEVEVHSVPDTPLGAFGVAATLRNGMRSGQNMCRDELLGGKRLPRQIKQGDRVIVRAGCAATVVAIRKDSAWIVFDDESSWIYPLSDLTLDDKA